jgi:hypothetical protein
MGGIIRLFFLGGIKMVIWIKYEGGQELYTVQCPNCKEFLNEKEDDKKIGVDISIGDRKGKLHLSSIWGDYSHAMEGVSVVEGDVVEMFCPYCHKTLKSDDICSDCGATTTKFGISQGFIKICNRRGCKMHLKFLLTGGDE